MAEKRFAAVSLTAFATSLVERAGVRHDIAADVADVLVTGDLLGHTTHGLALLAPYLGEIERGTMARTGEPEIVSARPAAQTWDGRRLPGPWLTLRALDAAAKMAASERHRHRRHPPRASHRVPRGLPAPRHRARARRHRRELRSDRRRGRAARRHHAGPDAEPDRRRTADLRRPDPDRHLDLDHEHGLRETGNAGRPEASRRLARSTTPVRRPTIPARFSASPRARSCRWAGSMRATRGSASGSSWKR